MMTRPRHKGIDDRSSSEHQPGDWFPGQMARMRMLPAVEGSDALGTVNKTILGVSPAEHRMFSILARLKTDKIYG